MFIRQQKQTQTMRTPPPYFLVKTILFAFLFTLACQKEDAPPPPAVTLPDLSQVNQRLSEVQGFIEKKEWTAGWPVAKLLAEDFLKWPPVPEDSIIGRLNDQFFKIGDGLSQAKKFDASILCFELGLRLTQKRPDLFALETAANTMHLGLSLDFLGENREALEQLELATDQLKGQVGPKADSLRAWSYYYLGSHYLENGGDYREAKAFFEKSIKSAEILKSWEKKRSYPLCNLAICHAALGDELAAKKCFDEGLKAVGEKSAPFIRTFILGQISATYLSVGKPAAALPMIQELHVLAQNEGDGHSISKSWGNLGDAYFALNNLALADSCFSKALGAIENFSEKTIARAALFEKTAQLRAKQNRLPEALSATRSAIENLVKNFDEAAFVKNPTLAEINYPKEMLSVIELRGQLERRAFQETNQHSDLEAAGNSYLLAAALIDRIRSEFREEESKAELISRSSELFEAAIEIADTLARIEGKPDWLEKAFFFAEKSKSVRLLATERETGAKRLAGVSEASREKDRQLRLQIAGWRVALEQAQDQGLTESDPELRDAKDTLFNLKSRQRDLARQLEREVPGFVENSLDVRVVAASEVQKRLLKSGGGSLIEYFFGKKKVWAFLIDPKKGLASASAPADSLIFGDIIGLQSDLSTFPDFPDERTQNAAFQKTTGHARRLAKTLLSFFQTEGNLPARLTIVPDGILGKLPFEVLLTKDLPVGQSPTWRNLPWLFQKSTIDYAFSATLFLEKSRPSVAPEILAAFAPDYAGQFEKLAVHRGDTSTPKFNWPNARGGFRPLLHNQPEAARVAEIMKGNAFLGKNANKKTFLDTAAHFRQLLLSMHALANDSVPGLSQLVFTQSPAARDDGSLFAWELCGVPLRADLVVLSACETGVGRFLSGEGIESLARAFRLSGCPNVVMSLWQADDESAGQIVQAFFKNQLVGQGQAEALASAKRAFLAETELNRHTHPFYWATFVRVGEAEPSAAPFPWPVVLTGLFILSALLFLFFKKLVVSAA